MNTHQSHIPTEVYLDFLGRTISIRWDYHAILMVGIWFLLVPLCIITIRYGKPKPTRHGIMEEITLKNMVWWWFSAHKFGLYLVIGLSLAGLVVALTVSRGFTHSYGMDRLAGSRGNEAPYKGHLKILTHAAYTMRNPMPRPR